MEPYKQTNKFTENRLAPTRGTGYGVDKMFESGQKTQISSYRIINPEDIMHSMVNVLNNTELCIYKFLRE